MTTTTRHDATGKAGTVVSYDGFTIGRGAKAEQYPLFGDCAGCGKPVACADGTADWGHLADETFLAMIRREQTRAEARQQERDTMPYTVAPAGAAAVGRFADLVMAQYVAHSLSMDGAAGEGPGDSFEVADKRGRLAAYKGGQRWA